MRGGWRLIIARIAGGWLALAPAAGLAGLVVAEVPPEVAALKAEAEGNVISAQVRLAQVYERGEGVAPDLRLAREWYCKAARAGDGAAAWRMNQIFLVGWGVPSDPAASRAWVRMAADHGHIYAQAMIRALGSRAGPGGAAPCQPRRVGAGRLSAPYPSSIPPAGRAGGRTPPEAIAALVHSMAPRYDLDPALVLAVIEAESDFRPGLVSHKGATGLMQLIPETAARFGVTDLFDVEDNLRGGMTYLRWLIARFRGDLRLALAGYNAGEGAVDQYGGVPPYAETQTYVRRILGRYPALWHRYDGSLAAPSRLLVRASAGSGGP